MTTSVNFYVGHVIENQREFVVLPIYCGSCRFEGYNARGDYHHVYDGVMFNEFSKRCSTVVEFLSFTLNKHAVIPRMYVTWTKDSGKNYVVPLECFSVMRKSLLYEKSIYLFQDGMHLSSREALDEYFQMS
jgi:hypothetical protein